MNNKRIVGYLYLSLAIMVVFLGTIVAAEAANKLYFSDDFENGLAKWSVSGLDWAITDTDFRSGSHSITDSPAGNYDVCSNSTFEIAKPIELSGATAPVLSFWNKFSTANSYGSWDNVYGEISEDGGFTWTAIYDNYGTLTSWNKQMIDLTPYKDKPLLLRFRMADNCYFGDTADGWYIDDVEIKELSTSKVYFTDDFEGSNSLPDFSDVVLTANPALVYDFVKWTGCNSTSSNTCTVNRYVGKKALATFKIVKPPTVNISPPSKTITNTGPVTYTITYNGATTVNLFKVTLHRTGTVNGSVAVTGTGGTVNRKVTISNITGAGTLRISIAAGSASNIAGDAPAAGPSEPFTVDNTPPTLRISAPLPPFTINSDITYTITYAGADSISLKNADITLIKEGTAAGTLEVSGNGTFTRTVTISDISGQGKLSIKIAAGTAKDLAGNSAGEAGPSAKVNVGVPSAPTPISPKGKIPTDTPAFSWNTVPGADFYVLWIGTPNVIWLSKSYPANEANCPSGTGICSVTPEKLPGHGNYSWKVRGRSSVGEGSWSPRLWFNY
jgi:hypothetical protein